MKKLLSIALFAAVSGFAFSFDTATFTPNGTVSTYTKTNYTIVSKFGEYYRTPALKFVHTYDTNGLEKETTSYDADNYLLDRVSYEYDADGNRIVTYYYDANDNLMHKTVTEYGSNRKVSSETEYDSKDALSGKTIYKYEGAKTTESFYDKDGNLLSRIITTKNAAGKPLEVNEYFGDGSFEQREVYAYLDNGKLSTITVTSDDPANCAKIVYRYNNHGFISEVQTFNVNNEIITREFYENDGKGNPVAIREYAVTKKFGDIANELTGMTSYSYEYGF